MAITISNPLLSGLVEEVELFNDSLYIIYSHLYYTLSFCF